MVEITSHDQHMEHTDNDYMLTDEMDHDPHGFDHLPH